MKTLDEYRDAHPRHTRIPRDEYDLESYQDWKRDALWELMARSGKDDDIRQTLLDLLQVLQEDPRG